MFSVFLLAATVLTQPVTAEEDSIRTEQLEEVVVTSNSAHQRIQNVQTGAEVLQLEDLKTAPQLFGENDIMRSIQLLPGVKSESDASSGFQVRGGTSAQNQVLFDNAPVYNVGHMGGMFSAFNDDALAAATLYKGLLPAQYGGASSAVLDITGKTGNRNGLHGGATIGLLAAKATLEGPIIKDKVSFLVSARRTYMDMFLKLSDDFKDNSLYFYDVNAKVDWTINARNQLFLTFFTGYDKTAVENMVDVRWGNLTTSLKWLHHFNSYSNSQTTLLYSGYNTDNGVDFLGMNLWYKGHIRQSSLRQDFHIGLGEHHLKAGFQTSLLNVKSAEWEIVSKYDKEERRAWENAVWLNGTFNFTPKLTGSLGLRLNTFSPLGGSYYYDIDDNGNISWYYNYRDDEIVKTHVVLEPRASLSYKLSEVASVKLGYARTSQNIHALRNQSTSTPFDRYAISSNIIKPEIADQISGGFYMMTPAQEYDFSLEAYYRHISNVIDYRDGKSFSSEIEIERLVLPGKGKSYGLEFCAHKNTGKLTGWLAYTLSWSKTQIDGINGGKWYNANNDRRHDINIVAMYELNKRWSFNAAWVFNSGQAFTAPSGKYQLIDNWIYYYAERNGYRAPDYHRLDVSASWTKKGKKTTRQWVFGIYNLYNRYNPYLINFEDSENGARTRAVQYSLFGIVPSVAFNIKF
ncbi:MAG: TonB-dependent receptor plug domain-containing protein [Prevotella sp.]|nr:TonB-dependent receptor plug domain-containing protein [Prevotella sp.]